MKVMNHWKHSTVSEKPTHASSFFDIHGEKCFCDYLCEKRISLAIIILLLQKTTFNFWQKHTNILVANNRQKFNYLFEWTVAIYFYFSKLVFLFATQNSNMCTMVSYEIEIIKIIFYINFTYNILEQDLFYFIQSPYFQKEGVCCFQFDYFTFSNI